MVAGLFCALQERVYSEAEGPHPTLRRSGKNGGILVSIWGFLAKNGSKTAKIGEFLLLIS
jgi:hypothetical protein